MKTARELKTKLVEIDSCFECPHFYVNYMPDGDFRNGNPFCSILKKALHPLNYKFNYDENCPLPDADLGIKLPAPFREEGNEYTHGWNNAIREVKTLNKLTKC